MLQESKVPLHSANPLTLLPQHSSFTFFPLPSGLWDGGCPVQKARSEPCVSTERWSTPALACHNIA